jgi:hypothetical protein
MRRNAGHYRKNEPGYVSIVSDGNFHWVQMVAKGALRE